jgi:histidine kinase/DNA gyrase B/HSP90-like ATPase
MPASSGYELKFSHHVVEHLGLKLYQNKPTNVIAELVSNAWDANATKVNISIRNSDDPSEKYISVFDNGSGMAPDDIREDYLVIGKPKRRKLGKRYEMGRKGIGKLAPFGIAHVVDVVTVTATSATWLRLQLSKLLGKGASKAASEITSYEPDIILDAASLSGLPENEDKTGAVREFSDFLDGGTGTLILLTDLSLLRAVPPSGIKEGMGRRFTVTLDRPDFNVSVNGESITAAVSLPEFDFRIPESGFTTESVGGKDVRYWAGFVKTAAWPSDEAGVGVYAHGKIAQDRPFTFGVKGREIHTRYMYAVVEADFLDEMPEDVISTDRSSIDWDNPNARSLYDWGGKQVRLWIEKYRDHRALDDTRRIRALVEEKISAGELPKIRDDERQMISQLIAEVTPSLPKHDGSESAVTIAVIKAYLHRPTRELLKKLWSTYKGENEPDATQFLGLVERLSSAAVPEALSIAVTFAERAYALSCLTEFHHERGEPEMQKLLERFPWILKPGYEKLVANQQLRTAVMKAAERGLSPSRIDLTNPVDDTTKPDFVFLNTMEKDHIVVVELKSPREDLTLENREQLTSYLTYLEQQYPTTLLEGILVGSNGKGLDPKRSDIRIMSWGDVLAESKRGHIDMLAAMVRTANPDPDDSRLDYIQEFGGKEVWDALEKVATNDEHLANLLQERG